MPLNLVSKKKVCGGLAGLIAQTATYPIHIIKRRMQVSTEPGFYFCFFWKIQIFLKNIFLFLKIMNIVYKSFRTGFMHVLKTEGLRGRKSKK